MFAKLSDKMPRQLEINKKTGAAYYSVFVKRADGVWMRQMQNGRMVDGVFKPSGAPTFVALSEAHK